MYHYIYVVCSNKYHHTLSISQKVLCHKRKEWNISFPGSTRKQARCEHPDRWGEGELVPCLRRRQHHRGSNEHRQRVLRELLVMGVVRGKQQPGGVRGGEVPRSEDARQLDRANGRWQRWQISGDSASRWRAGEREVGGEDGSHHKQRSPGGSMEQIDHKLMVVFWLL